MSEMPTRDQCTRNAAMTGLPPGVIVEPLAYPDRPDYLLITWDQDAQRVVAYAPEGLRITYPRDADPGIGDTVSVIAGASIRRSAGDGPATHRHNGGMTDDRFDWTAVRDQSLASRPAPITEQQPAAPPPAKRRRTGLTITAGAVVSLAAASGVTFALWPSTPAKPSRTEQATQACEQQIKNGLKAPATAQWANVTAADRDWDGVYVTGDVDAQNSFGALLRTHWTCHAQLLSNGMWTATTRLEQ